MVQKNTEDKAVNNTEDSKRSVQEFSANPLFTVDAFDDGLAIGHHSQEDLTASILDTFSLRLPSERQVVKLRSRYLLDKKQPFVELEKQLIRLSSQGVLRKTILILGVNNDPFHPFEGRFDAAMKFLSLFERYTPGVLCIQTRSPLIVLSLPVLKRLGKHCLINFVLETTSQEIASRYAPDLPRVDERLKAVKTLSGFGISVRIQLSPLLPYGDWRKDASTCAQELLRCAPHIGIRSLSDGTSKGAKKLRTASVAQELAKDRRFHWLRPDAEKPLSDAIQKISPTALQQPTWEHLKDTQLGIFAA